MIHFIQDSFKLLVSLYVQNLVKYSGGFIIKITIQLKINISSCELLHFYVILLKAQKRFSLCYIYVYAYIQVDW